MKGLTDIPGIKVGHATDLEGLTGCTAILCESGAVGGIDVRGSATGSCEWDALKPGHVTDKLHGILLTGGSAFGLEAVSGVRRYLESKGFGFKTSAGVVPIVAGAVIYDLPLGKPGVRPTRETGFAAASAATEDAVQEGAVGAGTGATVGKIYGMKRAMKAGIGSATVWLDGQWAGVRVSALAVVNALGDVRDPETGKLIAGARHSPASSDLVDAAREIKRGAVGGFRRVENTTLVVVATNAQLSKTGATKMAELASAGVARAINPVWTISDGDVVFGLSVGDAKAEVNALGVAAADAAAQAIVRAVRLAPTLGGVPGLAG